MRGLLILNLLMLIGLDVHSQGTPIGDSPIYHYNGNVGIGSTSPERKLTVYSTNNVVAQFGYDYSNRFTLYQNLSDNSGSIYYYVNGFGKFHLGRHNNNYIPTMTIDAPNNFIGIGDASPSYRLDVSAGNNNTHARFVGSYSGIQGIQVERSGGDKIRLVTNYADYGGGLESSSALRFAVNGNSINSPSMYIKTNGNIGVGTASPQRALHVLGVGWDSQFILQRSGHTTGLAIMADNNSVYFSKVAGIGGVETKTALMVFKQATGNLGIGNTNPTEKLVVDGKILAEEIKVENVPASDYVFEPDYELKSLQEVESFIQQNKHLPDIPSAQEFKENGVGLGEMDDMLLRKVEELTLYVIELKKENEDLKEENRIIKSDLLKEIEIIKAQLK